MFLHHRVAVSFMWVNVSLRENLSSKCQELSWLARPLLQLAHRQHRRREADGGGTLGEAPLTRVRQSRCQYRHSLKSFYFFETTDVGRGMGLSVIQKLPQQCPSEISITTQLLHFTPQTPPAAAPPHTKTHARARALSPCPSLSVCATLA